MNILGKCGELLLCFFPHPPEDIKKLKKKKVFPCAMFFFFEPTVFRGLDSPGFVTLVGFYAATIFSSNPAEFGNRKHPILVKSRRQCKERRTSEKCWGISGVLIRLTTCKRLTNNNSLPKVSLITLSPPETTGYQVGRILYGRACHYPSGFMSWGYQGE